MQIRARVATPVSWSGAVAVTVIKSTPTFPPGVARDHTCVTVIGLATAGAWAATGMATAEAANKPAENKQCANFMTSTS
jgi:hypothetical protein